MTDLPNLNKIELLGRAVFAHLFPLTGTRATGTVTVTAPAGGGDVTLPKNTYMRATKHGEANDNLLYKVGANPDTADGSWLVEEDDTLSVPIVSNIGGAQQNLPADSRFRFDPPFRGLEQAVTLDAAITNGTNLCSALFGGYEGEPSLLRRMVFWQTMRVTETAAEFFRASSGDFPALLMIWTRSQPLQGRTAGGDQGITRSGRGRRVFRESFECYVGSGLLGSAAERRNEAMIGMQAATALLTDAQVNVDGESLSSQAGLQIIDRSLTVAAKEHFIYKFGFEANTTFERVTRRSFGPWDINHIEVKFPGHTAPEPTGPMTVVDTDDEMP